MFYEVSARNGHNINEAFTEMSEQLLTKGNLRKITGFKLRGSVKSNAEINISNTMQNRQMPTGETGCCAPGGGCC